MGKQSEGKSPERTVRQTGGITIRQSYLIWGSDTGEVFKQYFSGKIDSIRASEMLQSKVDHLPRLESAYFRGVG